MASQTLHILGVMTGTSCDGLDAACISISKDGWTPLWSAARPYPSHLRKEVLDFQRPKSRVSAQEWLDLHRRLGEWYGRELKRIISKNGVPDAIANHGQTIAHYPAKGHRGITLQMGEPTRIAHATGITVVSNFRDGDMAAGGQGAPLTPLFH
ncbi:MAG TPA: anhydro-N-acetylmuramic acid kinase, partial [Bdellovibrionales bacterium]|nr:anhydro-N-acetylmuramic acid kinase [Bdellovibrionales bacterium]